MMQSQSLARYAEIILDQNARAFTPVLQMIQALQAQAFESLRGTTPGRLLWSVHSTGHIRIGAPITASGIRLLLERLGRLSGVDKVHAHRFRRTFATWAINSDA